MKNDKPAQTKVPRLLGAVLAFILSFSLLPGCSASVSESTETASPQPAQTQAQANAQTVSQRSATNSTTQAASPTPLTLIPEYSGVPYVELSNNIPKFAAEDKERSSFEEYNNLDDLGRCGIAFALIGTETMPAEKRGSIGEVKPSGWHTVRYNGVVEGNYLYNRCHLIGYQLAGENANPKNLITGTRYLNTEGMLPFENKVANYVEKTGNHVLYRASPIFDDNNLVASGVQIEALSIEDDGAGVRFNAYCYNIQPGININYATGESSLAESTSASKQETGAEQTFVLNANSKKFHKPSCSAISQMKESNKKSYTGTRDELVVQGYSPCKKCNP